MIVLITNEIKHKGSIESTVLSLYIILPKVLAFTQPHTPSLQI